MSKIIDLDKLPFPDCDTCDDTTKKKSSMVFDICPGEVSTMYDCKNKTCRRLQVAILRHDGLLGKGRE